MSAGIGTIKLVVVSQYMGVMVVLLFGDTVEAHKNTVIRRGVSTYHLQDFLHSSGTDWPEMKILCRRGGGVCRVGL